jgi:hypothetical protein
LRYTINVDDNFNYMEEDERCTHGEYDSAEEAEGESTKIVDDFVHSECKPGMSAEKLIDTYMRSGPDSFIRPDDGTWEF